MNVKKANNKYPIKVSFNILYIGWTFVIVIIVYWFYNTIVNETYSLARKEAFKGYEKDVIMRLWATKHGGVYVPVDDNTKPNPYLKVEERDIETPSGKKLTLMNPAYITREVHEIYFSELGIKSHITSLNPIRKENAADEWEKKALLKFEKGVKEYYEIDTIKGKKYFRYIAPLITTKGCLKCHAVQGYKEGDIRGGISSSVNWEGYQASINKQTINIYIGSLIIWLIGFVGLFIVKKRFIIYISLRDKVEKEIKENNKELKQTKELLEKNLNEKEILINELFDTKAKLEQINAEKDKLLSIIAHDLRSPFQGFIGLTELMADNSENFSRDEMADISKQVNKSAANLYKLLHNLLEWVKIQKGLIEYIPTKVNLLEVVKHNIEIINTRLTEKDININFDVDNNIVVFTDVNMLNTILRNLLSNAVKFSNKGGIISVFANNNKDEVIIAVKDTGIGMNEKTVNALFKIGEKVGRKGTNDEMSTGLGLLLCKELLDKSGGKIWVNTKEGEGSTFYFSVTNAI